MPGSNTLVHFAASSLAETYVAICPAEHAVLVMTSCFNRAWYR